MKFLKFLFRHKWKIILIIILLSLNAIFLPLISIDQNAKNKIFTRKDAPDDKRVAIVFGAAIYRNKLPSDVLADRIRIAADLYKYGHVDFLLMTGGNPEFDHNEPQVMKDFALKLDIPEDAIRLDYAGFRTYDSCARAKKVFKVDKAILVTQESHLPRAIYLCEKFGINTVGVKSDLQQYRNWDQQLTREAIAKIFAFFEVNIFRHDPKFLGEELPIE